MEHVHLNDLLNEALRPEELTKPKIEVLKDVPLLTTDFYYIAVGDHADAYSFLEMDDAVVGREANKLGVRFACIRNISDPVVPARTHKGDPISDVIRADWSGLIYTSCGLFTSYNGALATWPPSPAKALPFTIPRAKFPLLGRMTLSKSSWPSM